MVRLLFIFVSLLICAGIVFWAQTTPTAYWAFAVVGPLVLIGVRDMLQQRHAILRNFPLVGHMRYLFEGIRPEIQQYFVESDLEGRPVNRIARSVVYQRAKQALSTVPFGTQNDVYAIGYEWMNHSLVPVETPKAHPRIIIGGPDCSRPYSASVLNIAAMSYGSLSSAAIRALSGGAKEGGFFHNTGEGGVSPHHLEGGGDLCWQIGTGYFGCRAADGGFDLAKFEETVHHDNVKLVELKLSQGAKPGKGGILPAAKITEEIARIRGVPMGIDVISPSAHTAFDTPIGLMEFIQTMRRASGGKPTGFKLCVGKRREFIALCKAMVETGITPDFISVDGGEGGTGAAPLEFTDSMGSPLVEGLVFVHNALTGYGLRDRIKVIATGKVMTGFAMAKRIAVGADLCAAARAFMFSLGCIQALQCNSNHCPTGVATQDPRLMRGLVVADKVSRVHHFHEGTVKAFMEMLGASGLTHPDHLRPWHIHRRVNQWKVQHYGEIFDYVGAGDLLSEPLPPSYARAARAASAHTFSYVGSDQ